MNVVHIIQTDFNRFFLNEQVGAMLNGLKECAKDRRKTGARIAYQKLNEFESALIVLGEIAYCSGVKPSEVIKNECGTRGETELGGQVAGADGDGGCGHAGCAGQGFPAAGGGAGAGLDGAGRGIGNKR
jgi:hypothetical protein